MEQFRQIGEVLGSLKALLVFQENIEINGRQCLLLSDLFNAAYDSIADEMRKSLRFEEKSSPKWKILEQPLRDLGGIFREGEAYVRDCLEPKESPAAKILLLRGNRDCVELHVHNLLACFPVVAEAIGAAGESPGPDRREQFRDFEAFRRRLGDCHLIGRGFSDRFESVWREDRWSLFDRVRRKKLLSRRVPPARNDQRLIELLSVESFDPRSDEISGEKIIPSSILVGSEDYRVRRRLGSGSQLYKEISWLGESFAVRHLFGDLEAEVSPLLSVSHPNVAGFLCAFAGEGRKEWFLVAELMAGDLSRHLREAKRSTSAPFSAAAAVDLMLQIARGMEYLHSRGIFHGDLNPSNVLVRPGPGDSNYLRAKVSGFGPKRVEDCSPNRIWHAPEVMGERERGSEKSDVYSFGMVCFEVLTGKVPINDGHLQGERMTRNVRAGERPLFPRQAPRFLAGLARKCWHSDPTQRPSFSSLCRVLRYAKRFVSLNPESDDDPQWLDYFEIESGLERSFPGWSGQPSSVARIPFQMFAYKALERERTGGPISKEISSEESGSDVASTCGDESVVVVVVDDVFPASSGRKSLLAVSSSSSSSTDNRMTKKLSSVNKSSDTRVTKQGTKSVRPPQTNARLSTRRNSESQLNMSSPKSRRTLSGPASDSELT